MFTFLTKDNIVVEREHQFNAEYLDGNLILLDKSTPSYIVQHIPNNSASLDVKRLAIISASLGLDKLPYLDAVSDTNVYHYVIPVANFWDYILDTDYVDTTDNQDILQNDPEPITKIVIPSDPTVTVTPVTETAVQPHTVPVPNLASAEPVILPLEEEVEPAAVRSDNFIPVTPSAPNQVADAFAESDFPVPQMHSDGESPIYRYKAPGIKNT